jgi:hypothetical protein
MRKDPLREYPRIAKGRAPQQEARHGRPIDAFGGMGDMGDMGT